MVVSAIRNRIFYVALFFLPVLVFSQERTVIEFYTEVPAVSDYVMDVRTEKSAGINVGPDGWRLNPGQNVKVELPFIPPNKAIVEIRLAFDWDGQVVSGTFEGWNVGRFRFKVFEELIYPHENQKRIYPAMLARGYEFRIKCNFSMRAENQGLLLQSLVIYWETPDDKD